jgi:hypothetical protein
MKKLKKFNPEVIKSVLDIYSKSIFNIEFIGLIKSDQKIIIDLVKTNLKKI